MCFFNVKCVAIKAGLPYVRVQVNLSAHEMQESTMKVLFIVFLYERSERSDKVEQ